MSSFEAFIKTELDDLNEKGLYRSLNSLETGCYPYISVNGTTFVNFCSNNYLALNGNRVIAEAMKEAIDRWGSSSGASRLIAGNISLFDEAESVLAKFKKKEAALIFPSGYQANVSVISTLVSDRDEVFSDQLNHASIIDGCRLSKAKISIYRHKDMEHLEQLLKKSQMRHKLIVTDSVFSMDGDLAPLNCISELADKYDAFVIVDDAHATGVLGKEGKGSCEYFGLQKDNIMVLGTGGKALGVGGAFFCCPAKVKEYLINKSRGFIYTTAPIPAIPAGLVAAINMVLNEPERRKNLHNISAYFHNEIKRLGYRTSDMCSHIIPVIIGGNERVINMAKKLHENGIYVKPIRKPTVPAGTERIRFSFTAAHRKEDVDRVINLFEKLKDEYTKEC